MLTPDQILDISVKSGLSGQLRLDSDVSRILSVHRLRKFAEMVAAAAETAEREACAQVCESMGVYGKRIPGIGLIRTPAQSALLRCAKTIRARGEKGDSA